MATRKRFVVEFESTPQNEGHVYANLKRWLKIMLRAYHFRCTNMRELPEEQQKDTSTSCAVPG